MPAERTNVSFEPRPLELLYSKYATNNNINNKLITNSTTTSSPFIKATPTTTASAAKPKPGAVNSRKSRLHASPWGHKREELGDLRKLGQELTKIERVQMFLDMQSANHAPKKCRNRSRSYTSSTDVEVSCLNTKCQQCSTEHKREEDQSRLRNLKSKLRLVAARSLPDCCRQPPPGPQQQQHHNSSGSSTSPVHHSSQRVVPLPLLQLSYQRNASSSEDPVRHSSQRVVPLPLLQLSYQPNASSSEDLAALREARQSLRHMLYPKPSVSRRVPAVWNYRFADTSTHPPRSRDVVNREYRGEYGDSSDESSQLHLLPPTLVPPACSPADDPQFDTQTTTTFDADRVDSQQFEYVFDGFSVSSSESSEVTTLSHESDTATVSVRAQRPSTTDTVGTTQRLVETRASVAPPMSPVSPRHRTRGGGAEQWPPQYTVVPSWPSVDDPYRFQYFGCGVHRDIMRRLHKSRSKRRTGAKDKQQQQLQQQQQPHKPHKLKVVMPSQMECALCDSNDCHHTSSHNTTAAQSQTYTASIAGKSAKSRGSLAMSVCTVFSRQAAARTTPLQNGSGSHNGKDKSVSYLSTDVRGRDGRSVSLDRRRTERDSRSGKPRSLDRQQPLAVSHGSKTQSEGVVS